MVSISVVSSPTSTYIYIFPLFRLGFMLYERGERVILSELIQDVSLHPYLFSLAQLPAAPL